MADGSCTRIAWQPLLDGPLAIAARATVTDIAAALRDPTRFAAHGPGLAGGHAGIALLHAYVAAADVGDGDDGAHLVAALDSIAGNARDASLFAGVTGVAWVHEHCQRLADADDPEDLNADADAYLSALLRHTPWPGAYDLVQGLVGFGVYALERRSHPSRRACVERIVQRLAELAHEEDGGLTWWTPDAEPSARGNLGLAHGVPCVVAWLGHVCAAGLADDVAPALLDGAIAWLLAQRRAETVPPGPRFGYVAGPVVPGHVTRSAWCYGDPGVAAALLTAARCTDRRDVEAAAVDLALGDAARPVGDTGVVDAGLCHGAAGLAHLYNRLYQATGHAALGDAARTWFARVLALRRPGHGVAGFEAFTADGGAGSWRTEAGLLEGAAGVALALLGAITPIEPRWDRFLLLDVPLQTR